MELATLRANIKRHLYRLVIWSVRWIVRIFHYKTIGRTAQAIGRGYARFAKWSHRYTTAKDRDDLRIGTIKGAERHLRVSQRRMTFYWAGVGSLIVGCCYLIGRAPVWITVPFVGTRFSGTAVVLLVSTTLITPFLAGRKGSVLPPLPRFGKLASEALLITSMNKLVMDAKEWKAWSEDPRTAITCRCVQPVVQLKSGKGYHTRISLAGGRKAGVVVSRTDDLAGHLKVDESQVFMSRVRGNENQIDLLVLYKDPWAEAAPAHPLLASPRPMDLWQEDAQIGNRPTGDVFSRRLLRKGDGCSALAGSIPRMGKTVLLANLAIAVAMDPYAIPLFLDLKGLDFSPLRKLCPEWGYLGRPGVQKARAFLKRVVRIIDQRNDLLESLGLVNLSRELSHTSMPPLFVFVDELAELLDSSDRIPEKIRKELVSLLSTIGRLGPTVGVNIFVATQRVNERSVPPGFRDLLPHRYALNCANATASRMILGQGGESNRADRFTDDDKGLAITERSDLIRTFYVDTENDLAGVAEYGYRLREERGTLHWITGPDLGGEDTGEPLDGDDEGGLLAAAVAPARVPLVDRILTLMDELGLTQAIPTTSILRHLPDYSSAEILASDLAPHGLRSVQKWYRTGDGERIKKRSYLREALESVAGPLPETGMATPVHGADNRDADPGFGPSLDQEGS